ncbi:DUF4834 family protein [Tenacibaculum maritimum]|uniref:DUF4834 family protein n=1 Tax=Tenacibaculum maritimum TaxID=107401 RepID=UPI003890E6C7
MYDNYKRSGTYEFLRTIFFIILIYYAFKYLMKLFGPYLMKRMVSKMQEKANAQFGQQEENITKEGETVIDKKPKSNKGSNNSVGEYIDFEEID